MVNLELLITALVTALACSLPGTYLVLRKTSLMSDAITHSVLPGIVIGYVLSGSVLGMGPWLGAMVFAMIAVVLVEGLTKTGRIKHDASIGLVFPFLFALGVILTTLFAENIHLDTDAILLGELAYIPLDRISLGWWSFPKSLVQMSSVLIVNLSLAALFFKELEITTFDQAYATASRIPARIFHYGLMLVMSLTAVAAFDAVGSVLMVAYVVAPSATAMLLVHQLKPLFFLSFIIATVATFLGYLIAILTDTNIAASIAVMLGIIFFIALVLSPRWGILSLVLRKKSENFNFDLGMLLVHLSHHLGSQTESIECHCDHLAEHMGWPETHAQKVIIEAKKRNYINVEAKFLILNDQGKEAAKKIMLGLWDL